MSTRIRLARAGSKNRPFFRIVVSDKRSPRDGKFIEKLGTYNPLLPKKDENRILFEYVDENPNGSMLNIGGIINKKRNVLGMMPHPERACEMILGSDDGKKIFESMIGRE